MSPGSWFVLNLTLVFLKLFIFFQNVKYDTLVLKLCLQILTVSAPNPLLDMFRPHDRPIDRADLLGHAEAVEGQGTEAEDWSAGKGTLTDAVTQKLVGIKLDSNLQHHRYAL